MSHPIDLAISAGGVGAVTVARPSATVPIAQLRVAVLADSADGIVHVSSALRGVGDDERRHVALLILLAEAEQRFGHAFGAHWAIDAAVDVIAGSAWTDWPLMLALLAVSTDLSEWDHVPEAVQASTAYLAELDRNPIVDRHRIANAEMMRSIALFHHEGCDAGRDALRLVRSRVRSGSRLALAADAGLAAMEAGCMPGCEPPRVLPPVPGGILAPRPDRASPAWLAARIMRRSPVHTCGLALSE
ncbi:hypothetical protein [Actinoplanes sp. NPDC051851]|uniref:hypothetical protein n=1 Tax=Actinoplanes sp. NPDC051851 TaxID=3154753 RepID=UPI0034224CB8